jgi:hypothetical protein
MTGKFSIPILVSNIIQPTLNIHIPTVDIHTPTTNIIFITSLLKLTGKRPKALEITLNLPHLI